MKRKFKTLAIASCCALITSFAINLYASNYPEYAKNIPDWRETGTPEEQLEALVKITPGTHHWMPEIAYRYQSLYWAAKQEKWEFANYQVQSMEKMIKRVAQARAKRGPSINEFRKNAFPGLYKAVELRNWEKFNQAFVTTGAQCMACHAKEGFPYITVPSVPPKPSSIVLGYPEELL
mgnify:CR=1 FL=1